MYFLETWVGWTVMSAIGSLIAAIVAAIYTYYTYHLLQRTNQTFERTNTLNEFEIYREISGLFNKEESRKILGLCLYNKLEINYSNERPTSENCINSTDINQLVLNPLEDLSIFCQKKLISIETINEGLGYKILKIGNCQTIADHISKVRKIMPNVFTGFEELYAEVYKLSTTEEQDGHRPELYSKIKIKSVEPSKKPVEAV